MRLAGLRADDDAITLGKALIRGWVTNGAGPMARDDIRRAVAAAGLLAKRGTLVLAVHAFDHRPTATPANVEVDLVDLYDGADPFSRVQLRDPADWNAQVGPAILGAAAPRGIRHPVRPRDRLDAPAPLVRGWPRPARCPRLGPVARPARS